MRFVHKRFQGIAIMLGIAETYIRAFALQSRTFARQLSQRHPAMPF